MDRKDYRRELSKKWAKEGLCKNCGARPPAPGRKQCHNCLDNSILATRRNRLKNPGAFKRWYHVNKAAGVCVDCANPARIGSVYCQPCADTESQRALKLKSEVMLKYGGKCTCCGEQHIGFLTIDHINNDGAKRRKSGEGGGVKLYRKLLKSLLDPTLQILCWNCNMGKRITGLCPHQDSRFFQEALSRQRYQRREVAKLAI